MADATVLKTVGLCPCGFESRLRHVVICRGFPTTIARPSAPRCRLALRLQTCASCLPSLEGGLEGGFRARGGLVLHPGEHM